MDKTRVQQRLQKERSQRQALAERLRREERNPVESGELSKTDQHPGELGTETFERERDLTALAIVDGELADIDLALRRLDDGGYGVCEECGKPIGDERLEAKPWALLCIADQARAEQLLSRR
jgi:DnaK suppressor protein